jgi:Protein of unknown function (DUF1360)
MSTGFASGRRGRAPSVATETKAQQADGPFAGYASPAERPPLGSYALVTALFNAVFAGSIAAARRSGRELPERVDAGDVLLIGTASHKLSRLLSKDKVTSFMRAPFTEFQEQGGPAEYEESPRGRGVRRAVGELVACPYCLGLWTSAGFHVGLLFAPRTTRLLASTFTALTLSDFLQIAYKAAEDKGLGGS